MNHFDIMEKSVKDMTVAEKDDLILFLRQMVENNRRLRDIESRHADIVLGWRDRLAEILEQKTKIKADVWRKESHKGVKYATHAWKEVAAPQDDLVWLRLL